MTRRSWNRRDLAKGLQAEMGLTVRNCDALIKQLLDVIQNRLIQDGDVKISGFATFRVIHKKERQGRNPNSGEPTVITARRVISFRPSKASSSLTAIEESKGS